MTRRFITILTSVALLNLISGCYSSQEIPVHEFWEQSTKDIVSVVTKSGDVIEFPKESPAKYDHSEHSITGISISGMVINLPADDIIWLEVRHADAGKTIMNTIVGTIVISLGIVAIFFVLRIYLGGIGS